MSEQPPARRVTINAAFLQEIKADHQQLKELLEELRKLLALPPALVNHQRQCVDLLGKLADQLAFHFSLEEAYGYFEDALEHSPRLDTQAAELRNQHGDLFVAARDLAEYAAAADLSQTNHAEKVAKLFNTFDDALKKHESAELNLVLTALEQDLGGGD